MVFEFSPEVFPNVTFLASARSEESESVTDPAVFDPAESASCGGIDLALGYAVEAQIDACARDSPPCAPDLASETETTTGKLSISVTATHEVISAASPASAHS